MSEFKNKLKGMQDVWEDGKDSGPGDVPEGTYTMQLQGLEIREAQSSGKLYINREHLIIDGEHEGEVIYDIMSLETPRGPYFIAQFINKLGHEVPDNVSELPEVLESIVACAPIYNATVKKSGDFTNVRINDVLEESTEEPDEKPAAKAKAKVQAKAKAKAKVEPEVKDEGWEIGDSVSFEDADEGSISGTIVAFDGEEVHVETAEGSVYAVDAEDLTAVEDAEAVTEDETEDLLTDALALAQAYDVEDVSDDDTIDSITEKLSEYEWEADELTEDEVKTLEALGIAVKKAAKKAGKKKK